MRSWRLIPPGERRNSGAEHEVRRADQAQRRPQIVEFQRLVHVKDRKRHEHAERDDFLQDLELGQGHRSVADAVGGNLDQVFEKGDGPADQGRDPPRLGGQVAQMRIPRERHEHVRRGEQQYGLK
jgi:hypothetical protein